MKFYCMAGYFLIFYLGIEISNALNREDLVFVILSQSDPLHEVKASTLESDLLTQTENKSRIYLTNRDFRHVGDWTVLPILKRLWELEKLKFIWMIFCTEQTKINVKNLVFSLQTHNSSSSGFIGRGLKDPEPTIIHHFASVPEFSYPLFAAGFGINHILLERMVNGIIEKKSRKVDFSIDASHELALFLRNNLDGTLLTSDPHFCLKYKDDCATYVTIDEFCDETDLKDIFFAVKTCEKFHKERIPIVKSTWGKRTHHIAFFSEAYDKNIPTVKLNVPNTEQGHCSKTKAIFNTMVQYLNDNVNFKWVVLSDDDTILSVRRIQKLVGCYDPEKLYIIGERYGYNVLHETGYNYITGGGSAVLSRAAVLKLAGNSCSCPSDSTPDDMYLLGICAERLNIELVHIPVFHQARPNDYNPEYLKIGNPISFHKHWMTDPIQIYDKWFSEFDAENNKVHTEL